VKDGQDQDQTPSAFLTYGVVRLGMFLGFFFLVLELKTQGLHLEPLHKPFFVMGFFEIGSHELFAGAGFEP
jgi:hypothetical protein